MSKRLDFLIIGAQKAGTTSLYKYLEGHPKLCMPPDKEVPFFTADGLYEQGWDAFAREFLPEAGKAQLLGKATPHYMADPRAPRRIAAAFPGVRLIAVLRNPIDRAFSHYKMQVRRGVETRSFEDAARALLTEQAASQARTLEANSDNEVHCYLAWGEYGRILTEYRNYFAPEQLLVSYTDDLERTPQSVVDDVMRHLGLPPDFTPENLGKRYHQGGFRERWPWARRLIHWGPLWTLWTLVPGRIRRSQAYWFHQLNIVRDPGGHEDNRLPPTLRKRLVAHFAPDVARLQALIGKDVPWEEFRVYASPLQHVASEGRVV